MTALWPTNPPLRLTVCVWPQQIPNQMDRKEEEQEDTAGGPNFIACPSATRTSLLSVSSLPRRRRQIPTAIPPQFAPAREIGSSILNFSAQGSLSSVQIPASNPQVSSQGCKKRELQKSSSASSVVSASESPSGASWEGGASSNFKSLAARSCSGLPRSRQSKSRQHSS